MASSSHSHDNNSKIEKPDKYFVEISSDPLDINQYCNWVGHPSAGAISTFIGVTRDNFNDKKTDRLEYEAYVPMALKKLEALCLQIAQKWEVVKIAIAHRIGVVRVGEPSVIIAISSAHRKESLEACHWAIDELKATVPIWKKEYFEDGEIWKENEESRARLLNMNGTTTGTGIDIQHGEVHAGLEPYPGHQPLRHTH